MRTLGDIRRNKNVWYFIYCGSVKARSIAQGTCLSKYQVSSITAMLFPSDGFVFRSVNGALLQGSLWHVTLVACDTIFMQACEYFSVTPNVSAVSVSVSQYIWPTMCGAAGACHISSLQLSGGRRYKYDDACCRNSSTRGRLQ